MEDYSCNGCGEHVLDCTCSKILRRERSTRVWQAIQCWTVVLVLAREMRSRGAVGGPWPW